MVQNMLQMCEGPMRTAVFYTMNYRPYRLGSHAWGEVHEQDGLAGGLTSTVSVHSASKKYNE